LLFASGIAVLSAMVRRIPRSQEVHNMKMTVELRRSILNLCDTYDRTGFDLQVAARGLRAAVEADGVPPLNELEQLGRTIDATGKAIRALIGAIHAEQPR